MNNRLAKLRNYMQDNGLAAMIVSKPENRCYFSGFTGSSGLLFITPEKNILLTDSRYTEQASAQAKYFQVLRVNGAFEQELTQLVEKHGTASVAFESDAVTYDMFRKLSFALSNSTVIPTHIDSLRMVKDESELLLIKQAVAIADRAFTHILTFLRPGVPERDIAVELEYYMRKQGAEKSAFDIIIASGQRSALPHGIASDKMLEAGDFITLDFGAVFQGYHSDITRTVCIGKTTKQQRLVYDTVLAAQQAGIRAIKPGRTGKEVDKKARQLIEDTGYGIYFGHGLGHGVGLAIHEEPRLSPLNTSVSLEPGMVVTVEPGIYLPGWGGVRIEDTVVVTATGGEVLTASDKQLIEIDF